MGKEIWNLPVPLRRAYGGQAEHAEKGEDDGTDKGREEQNVGVVVVGSSQ